MINGHYENHEKMLGIYLKNHPMAGTHFFHFFSWPDLLSIFVSLSHGLNLATECVCDDRVKGRERLQCVREEERKKRGRREEKKRKGEEGPACVREREVKIGRKERKEKEESEQVGHVSNCGWLCGDNVISP
jgi:hypothetical protein